MFFKDVSTSSVQSIMYLPKNKHFPVQDSPQCYYFSYQNLLYMHNLENNIPLHVKKIVEQCKKNSPDNYDNHAFSNVIYQSIIENAEDLLWIADEIYNDESEDYEGDWADDFLDKYGVAMTMARLMNLTITEFNPEDFTTEKLTTLLKTYGPIALGITTFTELPPNVKLSSSNNVMTANTSKHICNVEDYQKRGSHMVVIVGYNDKPEPQVHFIDPNYPEFISTMRFDLFKNNLHLPEFVHTQQKMLQADNVVYMNKTGHSINKKKRMEIESVTVQTMTPSL